MSKEEPPDSLSIVSETLSTHKLEGFAYFSHVLNGEAISKQKAFALGPLHLPHIKPEDMGIWQPMDNPGAIAATIAVKAGYVVLPPAKNAVDQVLQIQNLLSLWQAKAREERANEANRKGISG